MAAVPAVIDQDLDAVKADLRGQFKGAGNASGVQRTGGWDEIGPGLFLASVAIPPHGAHCSNLRKEKKGCRNAALRV
jgi:hypothetical protein